jgi:hypothetical protein
MLQFKHFVCDWLIQTDREIKYKGQYLHPAGINHSLKHGLLTAIILLGVLPSESKAFALAFLDGVTHYHIDWVKQHCAKRYELSPQKKAFWLAIGFDQLLHQLTYITLVYLAVSP